MAEPGNAYAWRQLAR